MYIGVLIGVWINWLLDKRGWGHLLKLRLHFLSLPVSFILQDLIGNYVIQNEVTYAIF